jgi:shikimate dehydrogenase
MKLGVRSRLKLGTHPLVRAKAELAAVVGHPVGHSLSPAIFEELSARTRRRVEYLALDVAPSGLAAALRSLRAAGFAGVNVTAPLKEKALRLADRAGADAKAVGAANVLEFRQGLVRADNTDARAFLEALRDGGCEVGGKEAVVFGAGGAARAVCWALDSAGARNIHIVARSRHKAEKFVKELTRKYGGTAFQAHDWNAGGGSLGTPAIWVNATPIGMEGAAGHARAFPLARGKGKVHAFDLVYRPVETPFLRQAGGIGMRPIPGLGMLVGQALATWELWFGRLAGRPALKAGLESLLLRKMRGTHDA